MNFRKEVFGRLPNKVVFAADVGGTSTRIALCSVVGRKVRIAVKYTFPTQDIKNFNDAVKLVLKDANVKPWKACIAGAGPVLNDGNRIKLTNSKLVIERRKLPFKALLINDLPALGYFINTISPRDARSIRSVKVKPYQTIGLIAAGTGLGKAILKYDPKSRIYRAYPSEGGHADLPVKTSDEFILSKGKFEWEDVLSGRGIVRVYEFLRTIHTAPNLTDPAVIMSQNTMCARATKAMLTSFFARCAKNFSLEVLCSGGIYIGGGVAAKNVQLFGSAFTKEFLASKSMAHLLKHMPVKVITNLDANLIGAAFAGVYA